VMEELKRLRMAAARKDRYLEGHHDRVALYTGPLAAAACPELVMVVCVAASFHDIGKIAVPDSVLLKPGRLDENDWERMRRHPVVGEACIRRSGILREMNELVALAVRHHHERWDGAGYPDRLAGEDIPLAARIIALADSFDAMTTDRPYRRAMRAADALREVLACAGKQFDPALAEKFVLVTGGNAELVRALDAGEVHRGTYAPVRRGGKGVEAFGAWRDF